MISARHTEICLTCVCQTHMCEIKMYSKQKPEFSLRAMIRKKRNSAFAEIPASARVLERRWFSKTPEEECVYAS